MTFERLSIGRQWEAANANVENEEALLYQAQLDVAKLKARVAVVSDANKDLAQADLAAAEERVAVHETTVAALERERGKLPKLPE